ncbi:MAG: 2-C-methyl-D-erythritol 4-phosphate cytidylyltransferase [Prolixibacteraceae bacterium]|jgi:2-C-methyl-D-erythritol 4-phosphate cytidylyltransferase|nr:2-C-methyl-D-erythritol 4-phosphate cytidylyltransferase [Prolixibacteraceae bacterium]
MRKSVIIVAGGNGSRMGSDLPKQFLLLENYPVLMWTILCFIEFDPTISVVVVLPESQIGYWNELCIKYDFDHTHLVVTGGETRFNSVKNGLDAMEETDLVAVHDGVRPLVSQLTITNCFNQAAETGAAIPALPLNESLRRGTLEESASVDRGLFYTVQTPQVFRWKIFKDAYSQKWDLSFTDDASVVEKYGVPIRMVPGNRDNLKITHPEDLVVASEYIKQKKGTF